MSPRIAPAGNEPLFSVVAQDQAGFTADFQELYSLGMDRALGFQKASLDAAVQLQADAIDTYKNAVLVTPVFGNLFDTWAQFLACIMEWQLKCLSFTVPFTLAPSVPAGEPQHPAEVLEHSMEIASGQQKKRVAPKQMSAAV